MRFSTFAITTLATCMSFFQVSFALEEERATFPNGAPAVEEEQQPEDMTAPPAAAAVDRVAGKLGEDSEEENSIRVNPVVMNFECDETPEENPELMTAIKEALVMAANEVHDSAQIQFYGMFIDEITYEDLAAQQKEAQKDEHKHKEVLMLRGNNEASEDYEDEEKEEQEDEAGTFLPISFWGFSFCTPYMQKTLRCKPNSGKNAYGNKSQKNDPVFQFWNQRVGVNARLPNCRLCPRDDDAMMLEMVEGAPEKQEKMLVDAQFYSTSAGRNIMQKWQIKFCKNLRRIPGLKNPGKCFIFFDTAHGESIETLPAEAIASIFAASK